ncbi:MAG: hypothetical protein Q6366_017395 [Candidatus Freyarchaeota archaeon]
MSSWTLGPAELYLPESATFPIAGITSSRDTLAAMFFVGIIPRKLLTFVRNLPILEHPPDGAQFSLFVGEHLLL